MAYALDQLWAHLKLYAEKCAESGRPLSVRGAEAVVCQTARKVCVNETLPADAVAFYTSELLAMVEAARRTANV